MVLLILVSLPVWGQLYKADKAGTPPPEVASAIAQALEKSGFAITNNGARYCEIWLRANLPSPVSSSEQNVTLPTIPPGAVIGVIRFYGQGSDRRGQMLRPGVYILRYGLMPLNDAHQGAAPQRDFLVLTQAADDRDLSAIPKFDRLVALGRKASLTPHPAVLSLWKAVTDAPGFSQQGDTDWVLQSKVGDTPIAIIVAGAAGS